MAVTVTHSTPADGTFSGTGATAWDASHTIANLSAVSKLIGSGSASAAVGEITLGTNLSMSGTTLSATNAANSGPTFPGGIPLTGVSYPRVKGDNLSTGDNDLYTVPANKRAILQGHVLYNTSAGNIVYYIEAKISGVYYRLSTNSTVATVSAGSGNVGYIFEAGEIISINTATNNGANVVCQVVVFDDSAGLKSAKSLSLASGDNTIYTTPASTTALLLPAGSGAASLAPATSFAYVNSSGAARTIYWNLVNSGGSPASTNQITPATSVNDVTRSNIVGFGTLGAGDFVNINTNAVTATQIAWVNVMEIT